MTTASSIIVPFLDLQQQFKNLESSFQQEIWPLLRSAKFIDGEPVEAFERSFARYCDVNYAVALDSGTAALHLALLALRIGPGDEVICPTNTFIATAAAIVAVGARPVFVDADSSHWQMDVEQVEAAMSANCKAVIAVHLYGQPAQVQKLREVCDSRGVYLVEDAAQAHGAYAYGKRIGSVGDVACFSFYPGKNLGAFGDGGAVTTNSEELASRIRRLRNHGRTTKYEHAEVGFNYRMDTIQAAALNVKLPYLDKWNGRRREIAAEYRDRLAGLPVKLPALIPGTEPVHHLFPIVTAERDGMGGFLKKKSIETGVHYPVPLHLQPAFKYLGYVSGEFVVAESIAQGELSLPVFPEMTEEQVEWVCAQVNEFFSRADRS